MSTPVLKDAIGQELSPSDVVAVIKQNCTGLIDVRERTITNIDPYNNRISVNGGEMNLHPRNVVRIQSPWERTCYA